MLISFQMKSVLFVVHKGSLEVWNEGSVHHPDTLPAQELLQKINQAERDYDEINHFEGDPWQPEYDPRGATFSWEIIAVGLTGCSVTVCGIQRDMCVQAVWDRLRRQSIHATIREDLTMNSVYLK